MANQVSVGFQLNDSIVQGPNFFPNANVYGGPQYATSASGVQLDAMNFFPQNFVPQNFVPHNFSPQNFTPQNFSSQFMAPSAQASQCPISQSQCEQLLSYLSILKDNSASGSGVPSAHQAATVMVATSDNPSSSNFAPNFSASSSLPTLKCFDFPHSSSDNGLFCSSPSSYLPPNSSADISIPSASTLQPILENSASAQPILDISASAPPVLENSASFHPISDPITSIDSTPSGSSDFVHAPTSSPSFCPRRSTRPHNPPAYLTDYSCKTVASDEWWTRKIAACPTAKTFKNKRLPNRELMNIIHFFLGMVKSSKLDPSHSYITLHHIEATLILEM
ncbi:hypothetical protein CMV_019512 [Castanea mollissima]|uniref:Uncharacterized protein n=1 Tax=Castanea mollissima TaxID=60419 RepID=A0A8J4QS47_9ROSI|nr:hypothetical protein CMV_019512 [Castanea mollissima]